MYRILITVIVILINSGLLYSQVPQPTLLAGEYWTQLFSASHDFQSNGSVRYIVQNQSDPNKLFAVLMANEDSVNNDINFKRYIYCGYSTNNGRTWIKKAVDTAITYGYPCVDLRNGIPVIAAHNLPSTNIGVSVFTDAGFGSLSFSAISGINNINIGRFPQLSSASNGNRLVTAITRPGNTGYYTLYNGASWSTPVELINTGGPSGQHSVESGPNGLAFIFGADNGEHIFTYGANLWTSTNNGQNFTLQSGSNAPPFFLFSESDTLANFIDGGKSGLYIGNEIHLVYSVYANSSEVLPSPQNTAWFKKAKIIHWSPGTGIDTVAGRFNMPQITDTLTHALVTPLCQPSMGFYNGYIYVTFTAFLRGNKQTVADGSVVNAGEIFITRSSDNGNSWSTPVNLTNTPNIEEKHSSAIRRFTLPSNDSVGVFYLRDLKAGGYVQVPSWGKAPVYGIYKKVGPDVLGIQQDLETAREFKLFQNYPNPFNPTTTISYNLEKAVFVSLKIYNILGEEIKSLVNMQQQAGAKEISFDAASLPSGVYFYTLTAGDFKDTKSMILLK